MSWPRIATLLLLALGSSAWSQGDIPQKPDGSAAERARIDAIRQQKTAELDAEDTACFSKFAVTDCQNKVGARRRQMLADLKRQEVELNAVQRQQKGLEQLQNAEDKAVESAGRERNTQTNTEAKASEEERRKILADKVQNHQRQAKTTGSQAPGTKSTSAIDAPTAEKNRAAYQEKLRALEKRRQERDQRILDHGAGGPPLPVAP